MGVQCGTSMRLAVWNVGGKSIRVRDGEEKVTGGREDGDRKGKQGEEAWGREEVLLHTRCRLHLH